MSQQLIDGEISAYVAGPDGFSEATALYLDQILLPLLKELGIRALNPWEMAPKERIDAALAMPDGAEKAETLKQLRFDIGAQNVEAIKIATIVIANLDGQEVDSGTAAELGIAAILGIPIFARRSDFRASGELGAPVNLQVEYCVTCSGGKIVRSHEELRAALVEYVASVRE